MTVAVSSQSPNTAQRAPFLSARKQLDVITAYREGTARLAAVNLLLHGIGPPEGQSLIRVGDALTSDPGDR